MKKLLFSAKAYFIASAAFSLLIVACLKEQGTSVSNNSIKRFKLEEFLKKGKIISTTRVDDSAKSRSLGTDCKPTPLNSDCANLFVTGTVDLPSLYPDLPPCNGLFFSVYVQVCTDDVTGIQTFSFFDLEFEFCPELLDALQNSTVPQSVLDTRIQQLNQLVSYLVELTVLDENFKQALPDCPSTRAQSISYTKSCTGLCIKQIGENAWVSKKISCGDACCVRTRNVCVDQTTNKIVFSQPTFGWLGTPECDTNNPDEECDGSMLSGCQNTCIDYFGGENPSEQ